MAAEQHHDDFAIPGHLIPFNRGCCSGNTDVMTVVPSRNICYVTPCPLVSFRERLSCVQHAAGCENDGSLCFRSSVL